MKKRRYGDNDRHFGPFTYSRHSDTGWRPLGMVLNSGGHDDVLGYNSGCHLKLHGWGRTLIVELPRLLPDFRIKHTATNWDAATVARLGRDYYYEVFPREYGFSFIDDCLHLYFGPQTHDSATTRSKCIFLPWKNWRFIRQSWYGPNDDHIETLWATTSREVRQAQREWRREFEQTLVRTRFEIEDFDGQRIGVSTHIEEREWRFGTGLFAWLSLFRKHRIVRSLSINFDKEVGAEKGSWKGGLIGTSIAMLPGELHEAAFKRYCDQEHSSRGGSYRIKFMGRA